LVTGNPKAQDVLHQALARAYVSEDQEREQLGKVDQALDGIVGFGEAAVMITAAVGGVTVPAAIAVGAIKGAKHGLRLRRGPRRWSRRPRRRAARCRTRSRPRSRRRVGRPVASWRC
jgi:hypothetical protein